MMGLGAIEALIFLLMLGGQTGLPLGMPPGPEDPVMARFAPDDCLFYTTWSGTVEPDADNNLTEHWLARPEIRESFNKLKNAVQQIAMEGDDLEQGFSRVAFRIAETCLSQPVGFYVSRFDLDEDSNNPIIEAGMLIGLGDNAGEIHDQLSTVLSDLFSREDMNFEPLEIDGQTFGTVTFGNPGQGIQVTWGLVDNQYLALTIGNDEMQALLANMQTDSPRWLTDLRNEISVDRVSGVTWINAISAVELFQKTMVMDGAPDEFMEVLGLTGMNQLQSAGWVSGLDDQGFICRGSVHIDGEPGGFLGLLTGEALEPEDFGKIAKDRMIMTGVRISLTEGFELVREIAGLNEFEPDGFDRGVEMLNSMLDVDIEEDIIQRLDDHAFVYGSINFTNPTAGWVLGIGASNEMELTDTHDKIVEFIRSTCEFNDDLEMKESEVNGNAIYTVSDTSEWGFMPDFSWTLADGEFLISMDRSSIRRHLRRESMAADALVNDEWFANCFETPRMDAEGPFAVTSLNVSSFLQIGVPMLGTFGDELFSPDFDFSFDDLPSVDVLTHDMKPNIAAIFRTPEGFETVQRQTYPGGTPGTLLGTAAVGIMPATMSVRRAAARTESANNIRQLLLSMHNYHDAHRALPARFSMDAEGKPLLSWRVHILPYLEEQDLYEEFHLDEPWDSEHNKALIERMPRLFQHPSVTTEDGKTVYVVAVGEDTIMTDPGESTDATDYPVGMSLERVTDGTSRTGVIFEANAENSVVWTKPDDLNWEDIEDPVAALFDNRGSGVNVAFADGSVQIISTESLREIFEILVKTSDGEIVMWDD